MRRLSMRGPGAAVLLLLIGAAPAAAQVGVAVKSGTEGIGVDVAVPVASRVNIRAGIAGLSINHDFDNDGITIAAKLKLSGLDAHVDLFPFGGGFHVSPGLTIHNGTNVSGAASVPPSKTFTLNDVDYVSTSSNPVTGSASVSFKNTAPSLLLGWGNLVPRGSRRWSVQFEFGAMFSKAPAFALALNGSACPVPPSGVTNPNCSSPLNVGTDPTVQANLQKQIAKVNDDLKVLKALPIIQAGFGYRFGK